jgi:hypothetical protein
MSVVAKGYFTAKMPLVVDKPYVWTTAGLALGMDRVRNDVEFAGRVRLTGETPPIWLKLVSLYTDYSETARPDKDGRFRLRVPYEKAGRALLDTFVGAEVRDQREVMVRDGEPEVVIR